MIVNEFRPFYDLLASRAAEHPALLAPQHPILTYGELCEQVTSIGKSLREMGIRRNTPVAVVMPDGPEMLLAQVGVAAFATAAPLNPKYQLEEFTRYLSQLEAGALIVGEDKNHQAIAAAQALGIPVLLIDVYGPRPGLTHLGQPDSEIATLVAVTQDELEPALPEDIALVIHTSGTTNRPKIVPLTHRNIQAAGRVLATKYKSGPESRSLTFLPMFHISGLVGFYGTVLIGGSRVCTPGFDFQKLFEWLEEFQPTSFTCAPTMISPILVEAEKRLSKKGFPGLRYLTTGSASLSPALVDRINAVFGVPLYDNYGLSETGGLTVISSAEILLRPGSVGKAVSAELRIMADDGEFLPAGQRGEIVARGPSVISGYWHNPEATAEAFRDGWFRTGDQGYFDEEGYLFLTGRIKELVNRGGEKISPYEIEEALLAHPSVAQAAAFATPHTRLGEIVAAAVVLKPEKTASEAELRSWLVERITYFKIPSKFVFVSTIPKNQIGKIERLKLAALYGLDKLPTLTAPDQSADDAPLGGSVEAAVYQIWSEVLSHKDFGLDHNFFDLGGTSIEAASMVTLVQQHFARQVTVTTLVEYPTLREFSLAVRRADPLDEQGSPLQPLQAEGEELPLFIVHGAEGYNYHYYDLAKLLAPDIPVYAFTSIGRPGHELLEFDIVRLAKIYITELKNVQPKGPYRLAGHSGGGTLAQEMAVQLQKEGETVSFLGMFDTQAPRLWKWYSPLKNFYQQKSIPYLAWLGSALQPEAYAFFTGKVEDGSFSEARVAKLNWLEATWYLWQYLRQEQGKSLPPKGTLPGKVIRRVPVKYRTLIWNKSELFFFHQAREIIKYLKKHPESMQKSEVRGLVRAAWQGLHTKDLYLHQSHPYVGELVVFKAEEGSQVKLEEWQQVVNGPIHIHKVTGDHGNHVRLPHAVELSRVLRTYLQRS